MSVVADFSVPADAFCLADSLQALPETTAELDGVVAHSPDHVMPFVWLVDAGREAFGAALAEDPTVEAAEVTDSFDDAHLYHVDWAEVVSERLHLILDHTGVVLEATGTGGEWRLLVRFSSREQFAGFQEHFEAFGTVELNRITSPRTPGGVTYGVSAKQREALLAALDAGYYDTPAAARGEEIAEALGVTQQAISTRLRRGTATLVENTLDRHRTE